MTPIATPLYYLYDSVDIWCRSRPGGKENDPYTHDKIRDPLLSVVLALALTAALAASGSDEPSGVTGPDRTASTPAETPVSPAQTPTTPGSGDAPTATDTPVPAATTASPAASGSAETDRAALAALYNSTGGENWLSDAPLGEWEGVTTNSDGRVIELVLINNALSGEIPEELGSLSNLTELNLGSNDLSGEITAVLGSLSNLRFLGLVGIVDLSGCVPSSLEDHTPTATIGLAPGQRCLSFLLQRYEATDYASASLARIKEVVSALGVGSGNPAATAGPR